MPDTSIKEAEILIDFSRGGYSGAGVTANDALLDSDSWRKTSYPISLWLSHTPDELTSIRR